MKKLYIHNDKNRVQGQDQKKKGDVKLRSIEEALKGIHEELIAKHKEAKANWKRCGREGHYRLEYCAKEMEEAVEVMKSTILTT
jgi:hypothetical protein